MPFEEGKGPNLIPHLPSRYWFVLISAGLITYLHLLIARLSYDSPHVGRFLRLMAPSSPHSRLHMRDCL